MNKPGNVPFADLMPSMVDYGPDAPSINTTPKAGVRYELHSTMATNAAGEMTTLRGTYDTELDAELAMGDLGAHEEEQAWISRVMA